MAFADILADPQKRIDWVLEATGALRKTGIEATFFWSSHGRRENVVHGNPSGVDMAPLLLDPGAITEGLSIDTQFGGLAELALRSVELRQLGQTAVDLSWLQDYEFEGRALHLYGGERGAAWSTFERVQPGESAAEPEISDRRAEFSFANPLDRLAIPWPVERFAGQQTCIDVAASSAKATAPHISAYDLQALTVTARVRLKDAPSGTGDVTLFELLGVIRVWVREGSDRWIPEVDVTHLGGSATNWSAAGLPRIYDGAHFDDLIFAIDTRGRAYFAVNDFVVDDADAPGGLLPYPEAPRSVELIDVVAAATGDIECMDVRLYSGYRDLDEALPLLSAPSSLTVASWRMDDNTDAVLTDYSSNANHATAASAPSWIASGEGSEEYAGRVKRFIVGGPRDYPAELISVVHKQYFVGHGGPDDGTQLGAPSSFKTRGKELHDWGDAEFDRERGLVTVATLTNEPVTAEASGNENLSATVPLRLHVIIERLLEKVVASNEVDDKSLTLVVALTQGATPGLVLEGSTTVAEIARRLLGGVGAFLSSHLSVDTGPLLHRNEFRAGFLVAPVSPTPFDEDCLSFLGAGSKVTWGTSDIDIAADFSVFGWSLIQSKFYSFLGGEASGIGADLTGIAVAAYSEGVLTTDSQLQVLIADTIKVIMRESNVSIVTHEAPLDRVNENEWFPWAITRDASSGVTIFYQGKGGDPTEFEERGRVTEAHTFTLVDAKARWGAWLAGQSFVGSIARQGIYARVLNRDELIIEALWADLDGTETNLEFYSAANEGIGENPSDLVTGTPGTISIRPTGTSAVWAPDLKLRLDQTGTTRPRLQVLTPRRRVALEWDRNWQPLSKADLDGTLTQSQINALLRTHRESAARRATGREVDTLESLLTDRMVAGDVARLLGLLVRRRVDKVVGEFETEDRSAMLLRANNEIWLQAPGVPGFRRPRGFRVTRADIDRGRGRTELEIWGQSRSVADDETAEFIADNLLVDEDREPLVDENGEGLTSPTLITI